MTRQSLEHEGFRAARQLAVLLVLVPLCASCSSVRVPKIDESGQRIFDCGNETRFVNPFRGCSLGNPAYSAPATPDPCESDVAIDPCAPGNVVPGIPTTGTTGPFAAPPPRPAPGVTLAPASVIAPVGSQVVLIAGVIGNDGLPEAGKEVEWTMSQESVGHFVEIDSEGEPCWRWMLGGAPKKMDGGFARGRTAKSPQTITRGTKNPTDDIVLQAGQTWISLTSAVEGTSRVTAMSEKESKWDRRLRSATVHWVDAQWTTPPPATAQVGQARTLTTTLTRGTSCSPLAGWIVRYTIVDGPPAGFAPDNARTIDVTTDAHGRASAEITPQQSQGGTCRVQMQFIRPAGISGGDIAIIVGNAWTSITWNAAALQVKMEGPAVAAVGSATGYRVTVTNTGNQLASDVIASDTIPFGMRFIESNPPGEVFGNRVEWRLGNMLPGTSRVLELNCIAERAQQFRHCVTARGAEGLTAEGCITTNATEPELALVLNGPERATVGDKIDYKISITNRGNRRLTNVRLLDVYDPGLQHDKPSPINRPLGALDPGQTLDNLDLSFMVVRPGRHCHTLTVNTAEGPAASRRICVEAEGPARTGTPSLTVSRTGTTVARVGQEIPFGIVVTNTGPVPLTRVTIVDEYPGSMQITAATKGAVFGAGKVTWVEETLAPGQSVQKNVNVRCVAPATGALTRISVTCAQNINKSDEYKVEIQPAPAAGGAAGGATGGTPGTGGSPGPNTFGVPPSGGPELTPPTGPGTSGAPGLLNTPFRGNGQLNLRATCMDNPISIGQVANFHIVVENGRAVSDQKVELMITMPTNVEFVGLQIPPGTLADTSPDGKTKSVRPVMTLRPGEKLNYTLRVKGLRSGVAKILVRTRSVLEPVGRQTEETTKINP